jgi:hypothetical protein
MRLSEAIRLGSMLKPQGRYELVGEVEAPRGLLNLRPSVLFTCALGAAADAIGVPLFDDTLDPEDKLDETWPFLQSSGTCPACQHPYKRTGSVVAHLNDDHGWTREAIADWVATIESECSDSAARSDEPSEAVAGSAGPDYVGVTTRAE